MRLLLGALAETLDPAHQLARLLERALLLPRDRLTGQRTRGLPQLSRGIGDVRPDLFLECVRILRRPATDHVLRELDLVLDPLLPDRVGCFAEPVRRRRLVAAPLAREAVGVCFESSDLGAQSVLSLRQLLLLFSALCAARAEHLLHIVGDRFLT